MGSQRLLPLALAATALLLAACGTSEEASDPASSPSPSAASSSVSSSPPPSSATPVRGMVSAGGAAEGNLETSATALPDEGAIETYAATLGTSLRAPFTAEATRLLGQVPAGQQLYAQTVYDGCESPDPATITAATAGGEVVLEVSPPKSTKIQCLVAERSVALLSVDQPVG
ncbi:hypothetical protein WBG06_07340 [Nocardioides sp. CCNWLW239]|uniref:hypothetical protein n=1 Tax=Nocardioides sp. CCNWLW239 TaxID=3128902 RepID=UPI003016EF1E